ncbi:hypothetical protein [Azospirillum thermophilum]|uniref:Uncharacterized protein n=1 Tax=Azospirillum thermophilum TaxID=2202148 RepID=A0A2S2CSM2_9PROT|nr:hypothetical protein [Azospirillum thermophilum]AWK87492.1 hypothetical protein DEW08_15830 [Azospirillum thermophilum]
MQTRIPPTRGKSAPQKPVPQKPAGQKSTGQKSTGQTPEAEKSLEWRLHSLAAPTFDDLTRGVFLGLVWCVALWTPMFLSVLS